MSTSEDVNPDFDNVQHFVYDLLTALARVEAHISAFMKEQSVEPPPKKPRREGLIPRSPSLHPVPLDDEQFEWLGSIRSKIQLIFDEIGDAYPEVWERWMKEA